MPLIKEAVERESERFRALTSQFRDRVASEGAEVGGNDKERERIYQILVSINDFIEDKLRET